MKSLCKAAFRFTRPVARAGELLEVTCPSVLVFTKSGTKPVASSGLLASRIGLHV